MAKKIKSRNVYSFKKGQRCHLDEIYKIQALCGGNWWGHIHEGCTDDYAFKAPSEEIIITRTITIEIIEY